MKKTDLWEIYTPEQRKELQCNAETYMKYVNGGKTERECIRESVEMAKEFGFRDISDYVQAGKILTPGDKVYAVYNEKTLILWHIGNDNLENGMNLVGAHVDSPHIDVKQNPLYENLGFAYLDTRYYGGIKKYNWVTIPLALHGVIVREDGSKVNVCVGEEGDEPVFVITDLLGMLAHEYMQRPASKVIDGESLDIFVGSIHQKKEANSETVADAVMQILKEQYHIEEEDFLSAELEAVPAGKAREVGFDRSLIMAYGHDDRACAFASLMAMLQLDATPKRTACCILVDKEEIGSVGASGMQSRFFENMTAEVLALCNNTNPLSLRRCLQHSKMLSADVIVGFDPLYPEVHEQKNSAFLGKGLTLEKYTGGIGKGGANDANAEYLARFRKVMKSNSITFQTAELGKVDAGGAGTIAYIMGNYGMEIVDCGIPVLCMHAPMELASKADIYEAVRGYKAFLKDMD